MTDLEIIQICADKMHLHVGEARKPTGRDTFENFLVIKSFGYPKYDPLEDDAQAMALVKQFKLDIEPNFTLEETGGEWTVSTWREDQNGRENRCTHILLNHAICGCVVLLNRTSTRGAR